LLLLNEDQIALDLFSALDFALKRIKFTIENDNIMNEKDYQQIQNIYSILLANEKITKDDLKMLGKIS
jgi:hypothetical protein